MRSLPIPLDETVSGFEAHDHLFARVLTRLNSLWVTTTYPFAGRGSDLSLHYASEISRSLAPHIQLGNRVEIGRHTWFHTWFKSDVEDKCEVKIRIEDGCQIAARCTLSAGNSIHLERDVVISTDVLIMDHAHAYEDLSKAIRDQGTTPGGRIRIGEGCRIGRGAAILCSNKGELVLGQNCLVAPYAVVSRGFPPNSILSGNPARPLQKSAGNTAKLERERWR
jgi:acetyltransferase-like isoleucine patch superfamily enzyme